MKNERKKRMKKANEKGGMAQPSRREAAPDNGLRRKIAQRFFLHLI